jgi:uncharacterized HAD superfamily protein
MINSIVEKKTFVIDIDGTICTQDAAAYEKALPFTAIINKVNQLYDAGHEIIYFTARGSKTSIDWSELTEKQLLTWGAKFHKLLMGKPYADYYIDDKALLPEVLHTNREW